MTVDLDNSANNTGAAAGDTFTSIEIIAGSPHADSLTGDASANVLRGQDGNDNLHGLAGADQLFGLAGDDTLEGGPGGDALDGGDDTDTASYAGASAAVTVDLDDPANNTGAAAGDTFTSIEIIAGSLNADTLTGDAKANTLRGLAGNDTLTGAPAATR